MFYVYVWSNILELSQVHPSPHGILVCPRVPLAFILQLLIYSSRFGKGTVRVNCLPWEQNTIWENNLERTLWELIALPENTIIYHNEKTMRHECLTQLCNISNLRLHWNSHCPHGPNWNYQPVTGYLNDRWNKKVPNFIAQREHLLTKMAPFTIWSWDTRFRFLSVEI